MTTHDEQQKIWDAEHKKPYMLRPMDSDKPSNGVVKLFEFLEKENLPHATGVEMGCGKERNPIWLAKQGMHMSSFDFSPTAIQEAKSRARKAGVGNSVILSIHDATKIWPYESDSFDFGVDCFASTDIESPQGRSFSIREMRRVLKPGAYLLAYLLSIEDEFHKKMIQESPADERNAFVYPETGKFEKVYDEQDITEVFKDFNIVHKERVVKTAEFFGKQYACKHFWIIFRKPEHV